VASILWEADSAAVYDATSPEMFAPAVLDPTVDVLAALRVTERRSSSPWAPAGWPCR
jgi:hypothetical protein